MRRAGHRLHAISAAALLVVSGFAQDLPPTPTPQVLQATQATPATPATSEQNEKSNGRAKVGLLPVEVARARLQEQLDLWRAQVQSPGAVAAWVRDDGEGVSVASGRARRNPPAPMEPTSRIFSGSIGKTFVAAVALQLVDEGKLDLESKLPTWFADRDADPWFPRLPNHDDITLRELLNHSSGLPEYFDKPACLKKLAEEPMKVWTPTERLTCILDQPSLFPAGQGWSYADTNYIVVGMVIERVTGVPFYDLAQERLLTPFHLALTTPAIAPENPGLVSGYLRPGQPFPFPGEVAVDGVYCANPQFEWTGGGFVTNALDLAKWARHLYGTDDVLPDELRQEMTTGIPAKLTPGEKYGFACEIRATPLGPAFGHSGWFPGYLSNMAWYADQHCAIAVQINTDIGVGLPRLHAFLDAAATALAKH